MQSNSAQLVLSEAAAIFCRKGKRSALPDGCICWDLNRQVPCLTCRLINSAAGAIRHHHKCQAHQITQVGIRSSALGARAREQAHAAMRDFMHVHNTPGPCTTAPWLLQAAM